MKLYSVQGYSVAGFTPLYWNLANLIWDYPSKSLEDVGHCSAFMPRSYVIITHQVAPHNQSLLDPQCWVDVTNPLAQKTDLYAFKRLGYYGLLLRGHRRFDPNDKICLSQQPIFLLHHSYNLNQLFPIQSETEMAYNPDKKIWETVAIHQF